MFSVFDFINGMIETNKFRSTIKKSMDHLLYYIVLYMQITEEQVSHVNPCPATPGYIWFQADFKPNNMPLKMDNMACGRRSISQIIQFKRCLFSKNINIFSHLKLDIALAILCILTCFQACLVQMKCQ